MNGKCSHRYGAGISYARPDERTINGGREQWHASAARYAAAGEPAASGATTATSAAAGCTKLWRACRDIGGTTGTGAKADSATYEAQLAERDKRISELEAQVADAAKTAEATEALKGEIAELKVQGESERIDFKLQLAGARNVKAARALLDEHKGDIDALKAAEPWLFADPPAKQTGKTGLPNAGATTDAEKQMKEWREIAGIADGK